MMIGQNLSTLVEESDELKQVAKASLEPGDCMLVQTANSIYYLRSLGDGWFETSGGWFDKRGKSPMRVRVNGCTWGGSVIKANVAAACGLCMEFSNRVVTSPIRKITVFPGASLS